jgi:hypothetical protein
MQHFNWKHIGAAIAAFASASVALLWSWNALAELFGGPIAEFRHVVSLIIIAISVKAILSNDRRRRQAWRS